MPPSVREKEPNYNFNPFKFDFSSLISLPLTKMNTNINSLHLFLGRLCRNGDNGKK